MKTPIDLLIESRWIIPVEPADVILENHSIAVDQGKIVAILQHSEAESRFAARAVKKLAQHIVIPGLVNLHTHAATALLRGAGDTAQYGHGADGHLQPSESRLLGAQFVHDGTLLACAEMLRGGITCFADMYFFPKAAAKAALACGMRAALGVLTVGFPTPYATDAEDYLAKGLGARDELRDEALLSFCLASSAASTVDDRILTRLLTLSEQCDLPIHLHLHETKREISDTQRRYGVRPVERLRRLGLLSPGLIAAHAAHLDNEEIALLAAHGCSIAHCPSAQLRHAGASASLPMLVRHGIDIGLCTDGAASAGRLDMFQEMRLAALQTRGIGIHNEVDNAHRVLRMATLNGARALGLDAQIGSLSVGKAADLCALDGSRIGMTPCYNAALSVVNCAGQEHVSDVWIAGLLRFADGHQLGVSEIELIKLAALWQNQICPRNV